MLVGSLVFLNTGLVFFFKDSVICGVPEFIVVGPEWRVADGGLVVWARFICGGPVLAGGPRRPSLSELCVVWSGACEVGFVVCLVVSCSGPIF